MKILLILSLLIAVAGLSACITSAVYTSRVEAAYPASGQLIDLDGTRVHVLVDGASGPPVLMIHGASANAREFTQTLAPRLSDRHRVFMVDRPGHGHTARPAAGHTLAVQADLAAKALEALAPGERAVVVGHSFGGAVALRLALDHPENVKGLVLLAPVSHDWGGGGQAWYNRYAAMPVVGSVFSQLVPIVGPAQVKAGIKSTFDPAPAPDGYYEASAIGLLFRPPTFRANAKDVTALRAELAAQQDRYDALKMPVIVFSGAKDTVISPPLHVGKLKHQVAGLQLVKLPDEGHMPHHGHGADVAAVIAELAAR